MEGERKVKYPEYILRCIRQNLGYEADDKRADKEIESMGRSEVFERYLEWQGMIGYADELLKVIEYIYDIDLED